MIQTVQTSAGPIQLIPQAVLDEPTLNIFEAASMTLVVGPNGAGKTRMLASMIESVQAADGSDDADHSDTLVVYYSPMPRNIDLPGHERFIDLQNGMRAEKSKKEPNLRVLNNIDKVFDVKAKIVIQFFSTNNVYKQIYSLLIGYGKPDPSTLTEPLRRAITRLAECRAESELSRRTVGVIAHIDSPAYDAEAAAREALSKAIERFLRTKLGGDYRRNILAASYTIGKHNKPIDFIQVLLQQHGVTFSRVAGTSATAQKTYDAALLELAAIATVLGDDELKKPKYVLTETSLAGLAKLGYKKYSSISPPGLSSGATALLSQFSQIEESIERKMSGGPGFKHLLLLIDEGDVFLHIGWQQKYVDYLNRFVEKVLGNLFTDIQLVLTTHSPVLMSDFPRDCIVTLEDKSISVADAIDDTPINLRRRAGQTLSFGAPLSSIINTTGNAGTMGAFAMRHIENVLKRLQSREPVAQYHIDMIDDPFVQKYIRMLADRA
jgi:predicted ATPase